MTGEGYKILQCYARGAPGHWEAICVDLDIAVQGTSMEDVKTKLDQAVYSYIEDAVNEDPKAARYLLNRRAPAWVRWKMALSYLVHAVRRDGDRDQQAGFDLPCPA